MIYSQCIQNTDYIEIIVSKKNLILNNYASCLYNYIYTCTYIMSLLNENEINLLRDYYVNKKKKFANTKSYYDGKLWGDMCGFDLSEPYSVEEVETFEMDKNILLDQNFKKYLTLISKELFVYSYPFIFELNFNNDEYDDEYVRIGDGGCSFSHVIYLKGNKVGTIWYDDGETMSQMCDNFKEYIINDQIHTNILNYPCFDHENKTSKHDENIFNIASSINLALLSFTRSLNYAS